MHCLRVDRRVKQQRADRKHKGRIQIENQALEIGTDVLQTAEIEEAGEVVPAETEAAEQPQVGPAQGWLVTPRPPGQRQEERQREQHPVRNEGDGIDAIPVGQLDDDGLAGESNRPRAGEQNAVDAMCRSAGVQLAWKEFLGSLCNELTLKPRTVELICTRLALTLTPGDGRGSVGAATGDLVELHLALEAVRQTHDGHPEVQQVGDDREEGRLLAAVLGCR
jgi:hypothetical protein